MSVEQIQDRCIDAKRLRLKSRSDLLIRHENCSFCQHSNVDVHYSINAPSARNRLCLFASMLPNAKVAFTLAEVLITLGIIGVVAALTIPVLFQAHANKVVETRLAKFYSTINQAIEMAENDYGQKELWFDINAHGMELDENGEPIEGTSLSKNWFDKYLGQYLKISKTEIDADGRPSYYFDDGTVLQLRNANSATDYNFYVTNPEKCINKYGSLQEAYGKCAFIFIYSPIEKKTFTEKWVYHVHRGVEPYKFDWDGTKDGLFAGNYGCNNSSTYKHYCSALIQYYGWKIPKEYPFKVSY